MATRFSTGEEELQFLARLAQPTGRRRFLTWSGITIAAVAVGCAEDASEPTAPTFDRTGGESGDRVDLGSGDVGILNYALALEQLEPAFYTKVVDHPYPGITEEEREILVDVYLHEIVHREFFFDALGEAAIPRLEFDFTSVDFGNRDSVLKTARAFEDIGVSAYNGAARFLQNLSFLLVAGKIVSVEARHAAAIRDLLRPRTAFFAGDGVVNEQGLDVVRPPREVLRLADPFIVTPITGRNLPTA